MWTYVPKSPKGSFFPHLPKIKNSLLQIKMLLLEYFQLYWEVIFNYGYIVKADSRKDQTLCQMCYHRCFFPSLNSSRCVWEWWNTIHLRSSLVFLVFVKVICYPSLPITSTPHPRPFSQGESRKRGMNWTLGNVSSSWTGTCFALCLAFLQSP
jgi:hypothetical protein